jgi:hypothetical protein
MQVLRDWEMYLVLGIFLFMDLVILTAWQVIDPMYLHIEKFPLETPEVADKDMQYEPQLEHCTSQYLNIWLGEPLYPENVTAWKTFAFNSSSEPVCSCSPRLCKD